MAPSLPAQQFAIAYHFDAALLRRQYGPVRRRVGKRRARREHERCEIRPRYLAQIRGDEAGLRGFGELVGAVVAGDHLRPARLQGVTASKPGAAEPEYRDRLAGDGSDGDQMITADA